MPFYAALSYDGRIDSVPADPLDAAITAAVNAHQRTDKGFGPALGPAAAAFAITRFEALGYSVVHGNSDWVIGPDDREIQTELLAGWASAAREIGALSFADTTAWLTRRRGAVAAGLSSLSCRSRRFLRHAERHALSRQIAVEQHIVVDLVHAHRHALRLVGPIESAAGRCQAPRHPG